MPATWARALTAAVAGPVFTSPSVDAVLKAILTVGGPAGVLVIVKNYTGDKLNFGLAAEIARTHGIPVDVVIVGDDVALETRIAPSVDGNCRDGVRAQSGWSCGGSGTAVGRSPSRGAGGGRCVLDGAGPHVLHGSAAGRPGFELGEDEVEFGLGIHGESGAQGGNRSRRYDAGRNVVGHHAAR
jgi:dihydroxyacetone kinase